MSRYRSGFMSRQRQGQPRNFIPWSEGERWAFTRFSDPDQLAEALASDDHEVRTQAELAFGKIGHVNTPLEYWLGSRSLLDKRRSDIVWIGLQAELDSDFPHLAKILELPAGTNLPTDNVTAHRNPDLAPITLSQHGRIALLNRFANDANLFEWCLHHRERLITSSPDSR